MCKRLFSIICLVLAMSCAFAATVQDHENIIVRAGNYSGGADKSASIAASIEGHFLTIVFLENLGHVEVEITTAAGVHVDADQTDTPSGRQYYISATGDYVVTFTLPNGDEYYGEFTVTD